MVAAGKIQFRCPNCGKGLLAQPELAGKRFTCPNCNAAATVPFPEKGKSPRIPPPSGVQTLGDMLDDWQAETEAEFPLPAPIIAEAIGEPEDILEKEEISVGELLRFIKSLPNRNVVRRLPYVGEDQFYLLERFRKELERLDSKMIVMTPDGLGILKRAREKNGWLCLEYGCAFMHLADVIGKEEPQVAEDSEALKVASALRDIEARLEIGTSCEEYSRLLSSHWLQIRDFLSLKVGTYPLFTSLIKSIIQSYHEALVQWRQGAGLAPVQFFGGGFGFKGAVEGMAIGMCLNSIVGAMNQSRQNSLNSRLLATWSLAARKIRAVEYAMRIGIYTNDTKTLPTGQQLR